MLAFVGCNQSLNSNIIEKDESLITTDDAVNGELVKEELLKKDDTNGSVNPNEITKTVVEIDDISDKVDPQIPTDTLTEPIQKVPIVNNKISNIQLSSHNTTEDCWVAFEGTVYDITSYIPNHPSGERSIGPLCGTSEEFQEKFKSEHGDRKVDVLIDEGELIGEFE